MSKVIKGNCYALIELRINNRLPRIVWTGRTLPAAWKEAREWLGAGFTVVVVKREDGFVKVRGELLPYHPKAGDLMPHNSADWYFNTPFNWMANICRDVHEMTQEGGGLGARLETGADGERAWLIGWGVG